MQLAEITWKARDVSPEFSPSSLIMQGSNDGQTWTNVFTVNFQPWTTPGQTQILPLVPFTGTTSVGFHTDGFTTVNLSYTLQKVAYFQIDGIGTCEFIALVSVVIGQPAKCFLQFEPVPACNLRFWP
jgi:hypothetical protein